MSWQCSCNFSPLLSGVDVDDFWGVHPTIGLLQESVEGQDRLPFQHLIEDKDTMLDTPNSNKLFLVLKCPYSQSCQKKSVTFRHIPKYILVG